MMRLALVLFVRRYVAVRFYGGCILISKPRYEADRGLWIPCITASWYDQRFHYEQFTDLDIGFHSEEEAIDFGFAFARRWIGKELCA